MMLGLAGRARSLNTFLLHNWGPTRTQQGKPEGNCKAGGRTRNCFPLLPIASLGPHCFPAAAALAPAAAAVESSLHFVRAESACKISLSAPHSGNIDPTYWHTLENLSPRTTGLSPKSSETAIYQLGNAPSSEV